VTNVRGFAELNRRLVELSREQQTKIGQQASRAGAKVVADRTRQNAPVSDVPEGAERKRANKSGKTRTEPHHKIKNSIKVKKTRNESSTKVQTSVTTSEAYQASFVEFGSIHNSPDPFMRTSAEEAAQDAIDAMAKTIKRALDRIDRKKGG
jgi:HK97 gp10 family phage protein